MYPKMVYDFSGEIKGNIQRCEKSLGRPLTMQEIMDDVVMYACCMVLEFRKEMKGAIGVNPEEHIPFIIDCVCKAAALADHRFVYSSHKNTAERLIHQELSTADIQKRVNEKFGG